MTRFAVRARLESVLSWSADVVESAGNEEWPPSESGPIGSISKMVSEAALLAVLSSRVLGKNALSVTRLVRAIEGRQDVLDHLYDHLKLRPYLWTSLGLAWVVLDHFDAADPRRRAAIRQLWSPTTPQPIERETFRILDQAWVRSLALGTRDPQLDSADLIGATALGNLGGGLAMGRDDLYGVTHAAMYATDFGSRPLCVSDADWVAPLAFAKLLVCDFDLAIELLMTDLMLGPPSSRAALTVGIAAISEIYGLLGFIPSPTFRVAEFDAHRKPDGYVRANTYHTTFVYGMLCAVAMATAEQPVLAAFGAQRDSLPDEWHGVRAGKTDTADCILHSYQEWLPHCDAQDRPALLRTIADAYLIDRVSADDLETVISLNRMASVLGASSVDRAARELVRIRLMLGGLDPDELDLAGDGAREEATPTTV